MKLLTFIIATENKSIKGNNDIEDKNEHMIMMK